MIRNVLPPIPDQNKRTVRAIDAQYVGDAVDQRGHVRALRKRTLMISRRGALRSDRMTSRSTSAPAWRVTRSSSPPQRPYPRYLASNGCLGAVHEPSQQEGGGASYDSPRSRTCPAPSGRSPARSCSSFRTSFHHPIGQVLQPLVCRPAAGAQKSLRGRALGGRAGHSEATEETRRGGTWPGLFGCTEARRCRVGLTARSHGTTKGKW